MSTTCAWPGCRSHVEMIYNNKPLCDKHLSLVLSEQPRVAAQARKQLNIAPLRHIKGRELRLTEPMLRCAHPKCNARATYLFEHRIPVCTEHMTVAETITIPLSAEEAEYKYSFEDEGFDLGDL
jgi:hypothetical protein